MTRLILTITLFSEGTFGRGDGVAGLLDSETEYDSETGLPFIRGRVIKGLLVESCADIFYPLAQGAARDCLSRFAPSAWFLFGRPGSLSLDRAQMHIPPATFPESLSAAIRADVRAGLLDAKDILETLTVIRRQTAIADETAAPARGSLRSSRCVRRGTVLTSTLDFDQEPDATALALLAACANSLHRAGGDRNRGRGRLTTTLKDLDGSLLSGALREFERIVVNQTGGNVT